MLDLPVFARCPAITDFLTTIPAPCCIHLHVLVDRAIVSVFCLLESQSRISICLLPIPVTPCWRTLQLHRDNCSHESQIPK